MRIVAAFSVLFLLACAGSAPPRNRYLLRGELRSAEGRVEAPQRIALGRVTVAPYLDQAGIVVETEARQVRAARQHEWAEPLDAGLRSLLRAEISAALGYDVSAHGGDRQPWSYTVDVSVDRLHGTMGGKALLDASYRITPSSASGETVEYRFSRSVALPSEGYAGLVDAEAELVRELARAIADSLRGLGDGSLGS